MVLLQGTGIFQHGTACECHNSVSILLHVRKMWTGKDMKDASRYIQQVRKFEEIPPPYPNGWYEVMRSCDLPVKAARAVSLLGENFAVYRGEDGRVGVCVCVALHMCVGAVCVANASTVFTCVGCVFSALICVSCSMYCVFVFVRRCMA